MANRDTGAVEFGDDMFTHVEDATNQSGSASSGKGPAGGKIGEASASGTRGPQALRREGGAMKVSGWGRGPIPADKRKFLYDITLARGQKQLEFSASKVDRMGATEAGKMLNAIHDMYGIAHETEDRLFAFDKALFFEHAINGASLLQPGRGELYVANMSFDIQPFKEKLGVDQRRFFRAYADDIAAVIKEVLEDYDPYEPTSVEKVGYVRQIAAIRGLQKYPHLIHDSSDACANLTYDERAAVANSKRVVLESSVNQADSWLAPRTIGAMPAGGNSVGVGGS